VPVQPHQRPQRLARTASTGPALAVGSQRTPAAPGDPKHVERGDERDLAIAGVNELPWIDRGVPAPGALLCARYRLAEELARGSSAVVYRGHDEVLDEPVAVKVVLPDGLFSEPQARESQLGMREEAVSAMRLSHPNILRVYNYEWHQPWELLVMELVDGEDLAAWLRHREMRRFPAMDTIDVGIACLEGLAYAHASGVVHNDIKPANVLRTRDGGIKICDFGLARLGGRVQLEGSRVAIGTPAYMSPERVRGEHGDGRSDLYSLAAMLRAIGDGRTLFGTGDPALHHHLHTAPPPSRHLPAILDALLGVALAKDPAERFQTASELRDALVEVRAALYERRVEQTVPDAVPARPRRGAADRSEPIEISLDDLVDADSTSRGDGSSVDTLVEEQVDVSGMVRVARCRFTSAYGGERETAAVYIDRAPVTNAAYAAYVQTTSVEPPAHWIGGRVPAGKENHPVVGVTLHDARSYAAWRRRRLPTAVEWEAAARGATGARYPWGDDFDASRCQCPEGGAQATAPIGDHDEGVSSAGCVDLIGNAWEWTESADECPETGSAWVFGGSFRHKCGIGEIPRTAVSTEKSYEYLGFRCALDAEDA
jgi:serine/threonine protein kinase